MSNPSATPPGNALDTRPAVCYIHQQENAAPCVVSCICALPHARTCMLRRKQRRLLSVWPCAMQHASYTPPPLHTPHKSRRRARRYTATPPVRRCRARRRVRRSAAAQPEDQVDGAVPLDVVAAQRAAVLHLHAGVDQAHLVGGDAFDALYGLLEAQQVPAGAVRAAAAMRARGGTPSAGLNACAAAASYTSAHRQ
jgi:hypothetical protein